MAELLGRWYYGACVAAGVQAEPLLAADDVGLAIDRGWQHVWEPYVGSLLFTAK